ncbi:MAG: hypothetical protein M1816_000571 [Peltula sp. TS41687]|nr:MAG: hypothetical protein M1816_000571 [Peltula sp. TS41687]
MTTGKEADGSKVVEHKVVLAEKHVAGGVEGTGAMADKAEDIYGLDGGGSWFNFNLLVQVAMFFGIHDVPPR